MLLSSFVLNLDRTNISNAISDNLPGDLGFGMTGINTGTLIYSFVFTGVAVSTNTVVKRIGPYIWLSVLMSSWADFQGFIAVRVFIAITEGGFIPTALVYLNTWYKTNELATRLVLFWGVQSFASAFSGLISFGIFRMSGIAGLPGWKWLFIIDGIFTQIIGAIAFFYLPANPCRTAGLIRGKGWFTEREVEIAVTRIIRDDAYKKDQYSKIGWEDIKLFLLDSKLWTHLIITFVGITNTSLYFQIATYFPTLIRGFGFPVTTSNLLTVPSAFIGLIFSILIAKSAEHFGNYSLHALIGCTWSLSGFLALELIPDDSGRWTFYGVMLFVASQPLWHGMQIAWMASNLAPIGKRTLALGAVVAVANLLGVPGSQIYRNDAPRFKTGNWINFSLILLAAVLFIFQYFRYRITNKRRDRIWGAMTTEERNLYSETTKHKGSDRLDFRFTL
ncbi:major facilitator superfamily domain-containing protein [Phycomyces nitens]|nr:major facilitator superfamily domain-containing protein [Phycomyces nitens]